MAYGLAAMAVPAAVHQCDNKSFQGKGIQHNASMNCCAESTNANCCLNHPGQCKISQGDNDVELVAYKELNIQFQPILFSNLTFQSNSFFALTSSVRNNNASHIFYKIRLHLYNRILLI